MYASGLQHAGGRLLLHQCDGWMADALLSRGVAASAGNGAALVDAAAGVAGHCSNGLRSNGHDVSSQRLELPESKQTHR